MLKCRNEKFVTKLKILKFCNEKCCETYHYFTISEFWSTESTKKIKNIRNIPSKCKEKKFQIS